MQTEELDVRSEPPARRHALILTTFADLGAGGGSHVFSDRLIRPGDQAYFDITSPDVDARRCASGAEVGGEMLTGQRGARW